MRSYPLTGSREGAGSSEQQPTARSAPTERKCSTSIRSYPFQWVPIRGPAAAKRRVRASSSRPTAPYGRNGSIHLQYVPVRFNTLLSVSIRFLCVDRQPRSGGFVRTVADRSLCADGMEALHFNDLMTFYPWTGSREAAGSSEPQPTDRSVRTERECSTSSLRSYPFHYVPIRGPAAAKGRVFASVGRPPGDHLETRWVR